MDTMAIWVDYRWHTAGHGDSCFGCLASWPSAAASSSGFPRLHGLLPVPQVARYRPRGTLGAGNRQSLRVWSSPREIHDSAGRAVYTIDRGFRALADGARTKLEQIATDDVYYINSPKMLTILRPRRRPQVEEGGTEAHFAAAHFAEAHTEHWQ